MSRLSAIENRASGDQPRRGSKTNSANTESNQVIEPNNTTHANLLKTTGDTDIDGFAAATGGSTTGPAPDQQPKKTKRRKAAKDSGSADNTDPATFPKTLGEFLEPGFGPDWPTICCVADDARLGMKGVSAAEMAKLTEIDASQGQCYFSKAAMRPGFPGKLDDWWAFGPLVLCDDVGEAMKGDTAKILALLGRPSFIVQTSKGSQQFGYILDKPITDKREIAVMHRAITLAFYQPDDKTGEYRDPGHQPPVQYARLPFGFNSKPSRCLENDGKPWPVRLVSWNPERKFSADAFRAVLGPWWKQAEAGTKFRNGTGAGGPTTYEEAQAYISTDHRMMAMDKLGLLEWSRITNGYIEMQECPWHADHHGTASTSGYNPAHAAERRNGIKCHHSNHAGKGEIRDEHLDEYLRAKLGDEDFGECIEKARRARIEKMWGAPIDESADVPVSEERLAAIAEDLREHEEREARPVIKGANKGPNGPERERAGLRALAKLGDIYQRGRRLVKVVRAARSGGGVEVYIAELDAAGLKRELARAAIWGTDRRDKSGAVVRFNETAPPDDVVSGILSSTTDLSKFRPIEGVISTPFMRRDGTVAQAGTAGYDIETGLFIDTGGVKFPEVKDAACSKADALKAWDALCSPIREYKFDGLASKAVAVAGFILPLVRPAVKLAPGIAIDAPMPGSGKTTLMVLAHIMATGEEPPPMSQTQTGPELDKKLEASYLHGSQFIGVDNIEGAEWASPLLCSMITSYRLRLRPLHKSEPRDVVNKASLFITGNNLTFPGDTARRFLVCRINPRTANPEALNFKWSPVDEAIRDRVKLVHAGLTILRAYALAGSPPQSGKGLGSFEPFAALVRDALLWIGQPDIATSTGKASAGEAINPERLAVFQAWKAYDDALPVDMPYTAKSLSDLALAKTAADGTPLHPDLAAAFSAVCPKGVSAQSVGYWLKDNKDKWAGDLTLICAGEDSHRVRTWQLQTRVQVAFADAPAVNAEGFVDTDD